MLLLACSNAFHYWFISDLAFFASHIAFFACLTVRILYAGVVV